MDKVFLNGRIIDSGEAVIGIDDSAYLYGIGLFETMRVADGRVLRLDDHLNRLIASAEALSLYNSYSFEQLRNAVGQVVEANALTDARLRLTLSIGPLGRPEGLQTCLLITAAELIAYPAEYYDKGVRVTLTNYRQNAADPFAGHQTVSYGPRLAAIRQAHEKLAVEALWFTTENRLAEACAANVFLVRDGAVLTPPVTTPVVPGIARRVVTEIAIEQDLAIEERPLDINDLLGADEVFLTSMVMAVLPVTSVEAHTVGDGRPGPLTKSLMEKFSEKLGI